jgi:rubredoxin
MPIEGMPDPQLHRICRRCGKWFEPEEGALMAPEATGPMGAMRAARAPFDPSLMRFQCTRCTWIRRTTERVLWGALLAIFAMILLFEKLGWL